ncbi:hypothetical protein RRF57_006076 [Xylaria bambusicola]|uniref:Uncharacterized protein n=1 Tax=Xylaria bambusicola TaxID=326684 RepID=A0AAN7UPM2_9PEZI
MIPICYPDDGEGWHQDQEYPLLSHCVYLAYHEDSLGTDLILDVSNGAATEFTINNEVVPNEEYEAVPESERWRAHPTTPLTELVYKWTRMYKELELLVSPNPVKWPAAVRFYRGPREENSDSEVDYEGGSELDRGQRDAARRKKEFANVRKASYPMAAFLTAWRSEQIID